MMDYLRLTIHMFETAGGKRASRHNSLPFPGPAARSQALILADQILNRLHGYACKGSRRRNDFYPRDLNWMADVLLRVKGGDHRPLRPSGE